MGRGTQRPYGSAHPFIFHFYHFDQIDANCTYIYDKIQIEWSTQANTYKLQYLILLTKNMDS